MSAIQVDVFPKPASVGSTVTVSGGGFDSSSTITIKYDEVIMTTNPPNVTTDKTGSLPSNVKFTVPSFSTFGSHLVSVTDANSHSSSVSLIVTPAVQQKKGITLTQVISFSIFGILVALGVVFTYLWPHAFVVGISAGALGGLSHEIVQSGGKFILPTTDESNNFCLGGLIGIIEGGISGLLVYQGLLGVHAGVSVSMQLIVAAIAGGFAVKGIADAANPGQKEGSSAK